MSLLFCEGFGFDLNKWDTVQFVGRSGSAGRYGDAGYASMGDNAYLLRKTITASAQVTIGGACFATGISANTNYGWWFKGDSGATVHLKLVWTAATQFTLYRGDNTSLATGTHASAVTNNWFYIEVQATIADSGGTCKVRVNGTEIINYTGDTKNAGTSTNIDQIDFWSMTNGGNLFDDLYILNGLGSTNNTFLGEIRVVTCTPNAVGSSTQFTTQGVANNWDNVNDAASDSTYNYSATTGQRDTYNLTDVSGIGTIFGVQLTSRMQKSDAGAASMKPAIKSSSSVAYGATQALSATVKSYVDLWEQDPATTAAWTISGVNALEAGAEVA